MNIRNLIATSLVGLFLLSPLSRAQAQDWEEIYTEEGVTVSRKDSADSKLFAFKGDTIYNQPVERVLGVLLDNDHRLEWVGRLAKNEVLQQNSPYDYVIYQVFDLPVIFADRDYVYHGVVQEDDSGVVTLQMNSVEHPDAPETVGVRADLKNSRYVLTPMDGGKTRVEVEIITDPMGMMPAWLTNMIQKSWPVETLNGIRGQFEKDHAKPHALPSDAKRAEEAAKKAEEEAKAAEEGAAEGDGGTEEGAEGEAGAAPAEEGAAPAEGAADEKAAPAAEEKAPAAEEKAAPAAEEKEAEPAAEGAK